MTSTPQDWAALVEVIEQVTAEEELMPSVVAGVRTMVTEVAALPVWDVAGHTRALLAAATRAVVARRGPTESELAFVAELGSTRARQGIGIEVVLAAIHVSERAIWSRTRERAEAAGLDPALLLDARELYDDWAQAVRGRLIRAHRDAARGAEPPDRAGELVRRVLAGGSAAGLAAAEIGLPGGAPLWVLLTRAGDPAGAAVLDRLAGELRPTASAAAGEVVVLLASRPPDPTQDAGPAGLVGLAGPVPAEQADAAHRLALAALAAAEATGRRGLVHAGDLASATAVLSRPDLAGVLRERHREAWPALGVQAVPVAQAVRAWLEADRDTEATARALFVHPNTVRNRVHRFAEVTGIDVLGTFGALDAWWLCQTWLADRE